MKNIIFSFIYITKMLFYKFIYLKIFLYPSENWLIKFEINKNQYLITIFSLYIGKIK